MPFAPAVDDESQGWATGWTEQGAMSNWDESGVLAATLSALPDPVILIDGRATVLLFNDIAAKVWPSLARAWPLSFTLRAPAVVDAVERVLAGERCVVATYSERVPVERFYEFRVTAVTPPSGGPTPRNQP